MHKQIDVFVRCMSSAYNTAVSKRYLVSHMRRFRIRLVNRRLESAMVGGPPARWAVFGHGAVVLYCTDAVSDVSVAFEAQRYLRRHAPNT